MSTTPQSLDFRPAPAAASAGQIVLAQSRYEFSLMMRNGEQLLLTMIIPVFLLIGLTMLPFIREPGFSRVSVVLPGVLALAVMSTAFTAQAISVGFDRRYGVLKLFGATPLTRLHLLTARTIAVLIVELIQIVLLCGVGFLLGWRPIGNIVMSLIVIICGTAAFSALAIALGGMLRAEATLATANAIYLILLLAGGIVIPQSQMPRWLGAIAELLPSGALGNGLRETMLGQTSTPVFQIAVLLFWCALGALVAAKTFKWE